MSILDELDENYLVSAFASNPLLLDDERAQGFEVDELTQPTAKLVMGALRNLEATRTPITHDAIRSYLADDAADRNGHRTGCANMPDVDALLDLAVSAPPQLSAVHRMIDGIRQRREAKRWAEDFERALVEVRGKLGEKERGRKPLFSTSMRDLLGKTFPSTPWLVTGLFTRGSVAMIGGPPKAGKKTWIASEIALAVATGTPAFGEFYAERGAVAYFYAEDSERQVRNRFRALLAGAGRSVPDTLHIEPAGEFLDITRDEDLARLVASARRLGPLALLVLDPFRDVHSGREQESDDMGPVMRRLRLLAQFVGCTVLVNHHDVKPSEATAKRSGGQRLRGSSAIHGAIHSGLLSVLECDGDGQAQFTNVLESEVKGARSAGRFGLMLAIEDDADGEAIRASWTYEREDKASEPKMSKEERKAAAKLKAKQEADEAMFMLVRELAIDGVRLNKTGLRSHPACPLGERAAIASVDRLVAAKRLRIPVRGADKNSVLLPEIPEQSRGDS